MSQQDEPSTELELAQRREEARPLIEHHLREVLTLLGEDPNRQGLHRTPERWAAALLFYTQGLEQRADTHLGVIFQLDDDDARVDTDDMIIVNNIEFTSLCEHHVAPIRGVVHIGYIPDPASQVITGLSKFSRVVDVYARRLQVQERLTQQIASAVEDQLKPAGVIVVVEAVHYCMIQRGVQQRQSTTITTARRGRFAVKPDLEERFLRYVRDRYVGV